MTENIVVRLAKLPDRVHGLVTCSPDGWYNVYLNDKLSKEQMDEAYRHELAHIQRRDLESERDLCEVEGA